MSKRSKVFGIGYAKTATSSLAKALTILGYKCIHDPYNVLPIYFPSELEKFNKDSSTLEDNDAFIGVVCLIYKELDTAYPGSKFILTVRDEDRWLKSIRGHLSPKKKATRMDASIPLQPFVREKMFNGHLDVLRAILECRLIADTINRQSPAFEIKYPLKNRGQ